MITKKSQAKLKKLRDSHNWCCIKILSDYNYVWDVQLIKEGRIEHKVNVKSSSREDLNEAIDEVYEKAKEFLKKETRA